MCISFYSVDIPVENGIQHLKTMVELVRAQPCTTQPLWSISWTNSLASPLVAPVMTTALAI